MLIKAYQLCTYDKTHRKDNYLSKPNENLKDVFNNGGFVIKPLDKKFVSDLEQNIKNLLGCDNISNDKFLNLLKNSDDNRISELFDIFNSCGNIMAGHLAVQNMYVKEVFNKPLIWTYPNVRIDKKSRKDYIAPPHLDEWILFSNNKGLVAWFPLFSSGYLKIYDGDDKVKVSEDNYWGLKATNGNNFLIKEKLIKRGEILFFRSDLLHESSIKIEEDKVRFSIQYRYVDLEFSQKPFKRKVVQKITADIKAKQGELLKVGVF